MSYKTRKRTSRSSRRKPRRKSKFKITSVARALIIEGLAVAMILGLFFGMRADLHKQEQLQLHGDNTEQTAQTVAQQDNRIGQLAQPFISSVQDQWYDWACN